MSAPSTIQNSPGTSRLANSWIAIVFGLFSVAVLLSLLQLFVPLGQSSNRLDAALLLLTVVASIAALAKHLPVVNIILAGGIAAGIGGAAHAMNDVTGFPFGKITFTAAFGPRLLGILPLAMMGLWAAAALSARGVARLALRGWRDRPNHGFHVIGLAATLMITFQIGLNSFGSSVKGWWSETPSPVMNIVSGGLLSVAIQVVITALLLDKFPGTRPPNFWPLALWIPLHVLLVAGLFYAGQMPEALLLLTVSGIIMVLALRSGSGIVAQTARIT